MTDKRAHLDEINRDWVWWTPEARNGARVWLTAQLEEAWAALEVRDIRDVSREAYKDTLDMATDVMKKAITRAEAAEKDAAYQRRHRAWCVMEARQKMHAWRYASAGEDGCEGALEAAEADRDKLAQRVKRLEEALNDVWARMDRARSILQDPKLGGNPKDPWMMLDTRVDRARAALEEKP
jgi:hypothetical protein